jgi:hypothetical protein
VKASLCAGGLEVDLAVRAARAVEEARHEGPRADVVGRAVFLAVADRLVFRVVLAVVLHVRLQLPGPGEAAVDVRPHRPLVDEVRVAERVGVLVATGQEGIEGALRREGGGVEVGPVFDHLQVGVEAPARHPGLAIIDIESLAAFRALHGAVREGVVLGRRAQVQALRAPRPLTFTRGVNVPTTLPSSSAMAGFTRQTLVV